MPSVHMFGASPDRQLVALAIGSHIEIRRGDEPAPVARLPLPRGDEALPAVLAALAENEPVIRQLIPFNDGRRAVVVQHDQRPSTAACWPWVAIPAPCICST